MRLLKSTAILILLFLISTKAESKNLSPLDTIDIKHQFNYVIKKSTLYNDYRVIKTAFIHTLKSNVFDSIDGLKTELVNTNVLLAKESQKYDLIKSDLLKTQEELLQVSKAKDSIGIGGMLVNKKTYNLIMWSLTIGLFVILLVFAFLFKRSNYVTSKTKKDLNEIKDELETNRRKAREREEKIVRKLHDEINRYKKKVYQLEKSGQN